MHDLTLLRLLFGNPAIRLRNYFGGPVALRHWIAPVLPLSEVGNYEIVNAGSLLWTLRLKKPIVSDA